MTRTSCTACSRSGRPTSVGALLGAALPVLGVVVIAGCNAFYWLPIRGESPQS